MRRALPLALVASLAACSAHPEPDETPPDREDAGSVLTPVDASFPAALDAGVDAHARGRLPPSGSLDAPLALEAAISLDAGTPTDGGDAAPASRFITQLIEFHEGTCAGYNADDVLATVSGPPHGGGQYRGGTDVVSLGGGGFIVVGFGDNGIVDGPGVDFVVFENPFDYGNGDRYVEPGEVAVSDDGEHWVPFPCTDTTQAEPDGGWGATQCGGMNLVYSNPDVNDASPFDLQSAGGDQYDLATIGVPHAKYVRIRNIVASEACPEDAGADRPNKNGFDLDAIAIIHADLP